MNTHKFLYLAMSILLSTTPAFTQGITNAVDMKFGNLKYILSKPSDYDDSQKYPTILFLHGGDGSNTKHHPSKYAAKAGIPFPFIVIAPSCNSGCSWSSVDLEGVLKQASNKANIDLARVYLTGYSMGGAGSWANLKKISHLLAAASPLAPAGGTTSDLCKAKDLPIRVYHGTADSGHRNSQKMVNYLKECGAENVELVSLEGKGHGIWPGIFSDQTFYDWLLSNSR